MKRNRRYNLNTKHVKASIPSPYSIGWTLALVFIVLLAIPVIIFIFPLITFLFTLLISSPLLFLLGAFAIFWVLFSFWAVINAIIH